MRGPCQESLLAPSEPWRGLCCGLISVCQRPLLKAWPPLVALSKGRNLKEEGLVGGDAVTEHHSRSPLFLSLQQPSSKQAPLSHAPRVMSCATRGLNTMVQWARTKTPKTVSQIKASPLYMLIISQYQKMERHRCAYTGCGCKSLRRYLLMALPAVGC